MRKIIDISNKNREEIFEFIREVLAIDFHILNSLKYSKEEDLAKEHLRFDFSGIDKDDYSCSAQNQFVLHKFDFLGIYDFMDYLNIYIRKGNVSFFYKQNDGTPKYEDLTGLGTCEIIYRVLEVTNKIKTIGS